MNNPALSPKELAQLDQKLIQRLSNHLVGPLKSGSNETTFRNRTVEKLAKHLTLKSKGNSADLKAFEKLEEHLRAKGLFEIRIEHRVQDGVDGAKTEYTLARAAVTDMWPMGTNYWVRDNAIIGARYLLSGNSEEKRLIGKKLLLTALRVMSSKAQIKRFKTIIKKQNDSFSHSANSWPMIFTTIADNLDCSRDEHWAHKQDAWQILAVFLVRAIQRQEISIKELGSNGKEFLGVIIPFLATVKFWQVESNGSWEEIGAVRSSTIAWEHTLILLLAEVSETKEFEFLKKEFAAHRKLLSAKIQSLTLSQCVSWMSKETTKVVRKALPLESPNYPKGNPSYRESDSALIYLLQLDYPALVYKGESEPLILNEVMKLFDKKTGGFYRYSNDSYQRCGFFRNVTVNKLNELYGAPSGDASMHFKGREEILPKGRKAAWAHFTWQLSAWAGRRYLQTGKEKFEKLHRQMFINGLRMVTGSNEVSLDVDSKGRVELIKIPPYRMPECYLTEKDASGRTLIFPSPHTPLNWAVGEMEDAFFVRRLVLGAA